MGMIPEIDRIHYAGSNPARIGFLEHVTGGKTEVIPLGSGLELKATHPLAVAQGKIAHIQQTIEKPTGCCVAFDTLAYVPVDDLDYEVRGKPSDMASVQQLFWKMSQRADPSYRLCAASVLECNGNKRTASHDASVSLSPRRLALLSTDAGFSTYVSLVSDFGHQFSEDQSPLAMTAGLHLEALMALDCVEAVDDVPQGTQGFGGRAERAFFLATVGASHKVLSPLTHDPMRHIITFPFHRDRLALLHKYAGAA